MEETNNYKKTTKISKKIGFSLSIFFTFSTKIVRMDSISANIPFL